MSKDRPDDSGDDSFPSGHTDSFMAATFIQQRYGWQYGLPAYVAASWWPHPEAGRATNIISEDEVLN